MNSCGTASCVPGYFFFLPVFLPAAFVLGRCLLGTARILVAAAALPPVFLPNAFSQPAVYLSVAPTRTIVTVVFCEKSNSLEMFHGNQKK